MRHREISDTPEERVAGYVVALEVSGV